MAPADLEARMGFPVTHFEEALETVGWKPEDVDIIIHTHLHNDHCLKTTACALMRNFMSKKPNSTFATIRIPLTTVIIL